MDRSHPERDGIWFLSPDLMLKADIGNGALLSTNPAWTNLLGWNQDQLRALGLFDLVHPEDLRLTREQASHATSALPGAAFINRCRHADGSHRRISWRAVRDGQYLYAIGREVVDDGDTEGREDRQLEAVGQLAAVIAHDFNNLLQGIAGSLELTRKLIETGRAHEAEKFIGNAISSVRRASVLTQHLFDFSSRDPFEPIAVDVNQIIAALEPALRRSLTPDATLELVHSADLWTTFCDTKQLENTIGALVRMAREAMPAGGRIVLETANEPADAARGEHVRIAVTDSGKGYPADVVEHAFDPFYTIRKIGLSRSLGLSRIHSFAAKASGFAMMKSAPEAGTTITLYLPRFRED